MIIDQEKVSSVTLWPHPSTMPNACFLTFANFYHCFICGFSTVSAPLTSILRNLHGTPRLRRLSIALKRHTPQPHIFLKQAVLGPLATNKPPAMLDIDSWPLYWVNILDSCCTLAGRTICWSEKVTSLKSSAGCNTRTSQTQHCFMTSSTSTLISPYLIPENTLFLRFVLFDF